MKAAASPAGGVRCRFCRHYYLTWEPASPHGCKMMGFKSQNLPSAVVRRNSGLDCQAFTPRPGSIKN